MALIRIKNTKSSADVLVHEVSTRSAADLLVRVVETRSAAEGKDELWRFVETDSAATSKICFVSTRSAANLLIHYVSTRSAAGWTHDQLSQQFVLPSASPDTLLPELERKLKEALDRELSSRGVSAPPAPPPSPPNDTTYLFSVRYEIEREARRILNARSIAVEDQRRFSFGALISTLMQLEVLDPQIARAAREIYSICSLAIHGEDVSPAKTAFVRDLGPKVIATLKAIQE